MASKPTIDSHKRFQGISDYLKESANGQLQDLYYFGVAVNFRDDPQALTLLPSSVKESSNVVTDLVLWGDIVPATLTSFYYGNTGNLYQRTSAPVWSKITQVPNSHGNGLSYFAGDDYLYLPGDSTLNRYGPTQSNPTFQPDFLGAQGGTPLNTASLSLTASSSQSADAADSASLSIISDLTLEAYLYPSSLPTAGNEMGIIAKWDETGATRSYKLSLYAASAFFGDGSDGALTISSNTTDAPTLAACSGTAGTQTLSATNASFAAGKVILILQMQGTGAGQWERNTIQAYTAGTITTGTPLLGTYSSSGSNTAQVIVLPQYSAVTVNTGITWTPMAWTGSTGGVLAFLCNGTTTINGTIDGSGPDGVFVGPADNPGGNVNRTPRMGFGGGEVTESNSSYAYRGEGTGGGRATQQGSANGNGGGGGGFFSSVSTSTSGGGGGGGGNTSSATAGSTRGGGVGGAAASSAGASDLTSMVLGGGGGGGSGGSGSEQGSGGSGGAIVFPTSATFTMGVSGAITVNGGDGGSSGSSGVQGGSGGGGSGGSVLIKAQTATLGTSQITASAGVGGSGGATGGNGAEGRIVLNYSSSYTGTTSPTLNPIMDSSLNTSPVIQARLYISANGTTFDTLSMNMPTLTTTDWARLSVAWDASASTAYFYLNAILLGTAVGSRTAIDDNGSLLYLGAYKGASAIQSYFDGLIDDVRIWNTLQTQGQILANLNSQLSGSEAGLAAYWTLNSTYNDTTANANTLTPRNTPVFVSDVPFPAPTTRLDIDQSYTTAGNTTALGTSIVEGTTTEIQFTPQYDPQKSVAFNINTKGTGDWTVYVHDQQNRLIASATIANADLASAGWQEFTFTTPWRIVIGKTYHLHLISTVADGIVVSSSNNNFSTADFYTYFAFLVTDTQYHPAISFLDFVAFGNERYIAKWDGAFYEPNFIAFPPAWKVRCFGYWREFLAVGMWRGGEIYDFDKGRIYFWDGIAPTFNFFVDVPEGQINALFGVDSDLYMFAGSRGLLLDYQGGYFYTTGNTKSNKLKRMPLLASTDYTEVLPGALNMWRGMLHFGLYGNSNSTTAVRGTYSYGTINQYYPDALSCDYVISTGNSGNTVTIGMVYPVGQDLLVSWQDGIAFGVDVVSFDNPYASSGSVSFMTQDDGVIWHEKANFTVRLDVLPLPDGASVASTFAIDRQTPLVSDVVATEDTTFTHQLVTAGRGREYQYGAQLFSDGTVTPTLVGASLQRNPLSEEQKF